MLGILNSFESRLQRLENTIVPVYNETENLRRRQESILCLVSVVCLKRYDMSLWQKVLLLNLGLFVYSYLFSFYYSYTKLWLLLFSMHWLVIKLKIGSFGHQEEDWKQKYLMKTKIGFRKVGQRGLFNFRWKQQLTSWTILPNLYTIWLLNKLTLASSWVASQAWCFIHQKMKLKIHQTYVTDFVQNSSKFKDRLLLSITAYTADLHFSYLH